MSFVNPARFTTRPEITGTFGVVASTHWIATAVGMGILERDGNAFDAGVARPSRCRSSSRISMDPAAMCRSWCMPQRRA